VTPCRAETLAQKELHDVDRRKNYSNRWADSRDAKQQQGLLQQQERHKRWKHQYQKGRDSDRDSGSSIDSTPSRDSKDVNNSKNSSSSRDASSSTDHENSRDPRNANSRGLPRDVVYLV